ncbi:MAG: pilus assembly protein PilP [Bdellovibrio sp.]|nr:pilus assembly protein PilP [Bdellovibrio sp.]
MKPIFFISVIGLLLVQLAWSQGNPPNQPRPAANTQQPAQNRPMNQMPQQAPANQQPSRGNGQPAAATVPQTNPIPMSQQSTTTQISAMDGLEGLNLKSESLGRRDPFTLPLYIINKLKAKDIGPPVSRVDDSVEPIRRWPLVSYTLVGIIWDVKNAKALIRDQANHVHILKVRDRIGYDKGVITDIREGSVTVLENEIPQVLKLRK